MYNIEKEKGYERVMRMVWENPLNQQKPCIHKWLMQYCNNFQECILDIGAGNGYYLSSVHVKNIIAIEPNFILQNKLKGKCNEENINLKIFNNLNEYLNSRVKVKISYILLIHTYLYLKEHEIDLYISIARNSDSIIVTPSPERSVSFLFEESIGIM